MTNQTNNPNNHIDVELERETLGLIISAARDQGSEAMPVLERDVLAAPRQLMAIDQHQLVWNAVRAMVEAGTPPTPYELKALTDGQVTPATWAGILAADQAQNLALNLDRLKTLSASRQIVATCSAAVAALREGAEPDQVAGVLAEGVETGDAVTSRPKHVSEFGSVLGYLRAYTSGQIPLVSTGFSALDQVIAGGMEPGTYVLLGMATNVGKTRLALSIALHQLECGRGVTYVSGEMKGTSGGAVATHRLKAALVLMRAGISPRLISNATAISEQTERRIEHAEQFVNSARLHIHDRDMSTDTIASIARRMKREGQSLMIIDNLNHVTLSGSGRMQGWEEKNQISERLADIAHSTGVIILVLMQTKIDASIERPARLDEISDSKGVARPADLILTAWRPLDRAVEASRRGEHVTLGQISVVKRRSGVGGTVDVHWNEELAEWVDV